jgi:hypothetical protein
MTNVMNNFSIINFLTYAAIYLHHLEMEYISQLIQYARTCFTYELFLKRGKLLNSKLLKQQKICP